MQPTHFKKLLPLALLTAGGPLALNAYVPLLPEVQRYFGVELSEVQATVSFALVAYALGMLATGPLTDRIGHRSSVLLGLCGYMLGNLLCLLSNELHWLIIGRVLLSAGAAITFISSRAICAEIFPAEELRRAIAQLMMISVMVPVLAPMLGSTLAAWRGWRSIFAFLTAYGVVMLWLAWRTIKVEPHKQVAEVAQPSSDQVAQVTRGAVLLRPAYLVPISMFVLFWLPYIVFISLAPHLLEHYYQAPPSTYAKLFPLLAVTYLLGNFVVTRFGNVKGGDWLVRTAMLPVIAGFVLAYTLLWLNWRNPLAIFLPYATLGFGHGLALPTLSTHAIDASRPHTALGWGLLGFSQQVLGGVCVQLMGMSDVSSPYPVLLFGTGATLLFALLYWRGWKQSA
ncbi:MAG: MFS transporter [Steroidobacteraceae bacterium]